MRADAESAAAHRQPETASATATAVVTAVLDVVAATEIIVTAWRFSSYSKFRSAKRQSEMPNAADT